MGIHIAKRSRIEPRTCMSEKRNWLQKYTHSLTSPLMEYASHIKTGGL